MRLLLALVIGLTLCACDPAKCQSCNGGKVDCTLCEGGTVNCPHCDRGQQVSGPCRFCNATGKAKCDLCKGVGTRTCERCNGTGKH